MAFITLCGIIFNIWLGFRTLTAELTKQNIELNAQRQSLLEQDQANKVALWRTYNPLPSLKEQADLGEGNIPAFYEIHNNSTLPIFDIFVIAVSSKSGSRLDNFFMPYSNSSPEDYFKYISYLKIVAPQHRVQGFVYGHGTSMGETDDFVYIFRDTRGIVWFRGNTGFLEKIGSQSDLYTLMDRVKINIHDPRFFSRPSIMEPI